MTYEEEANRLITGCNSKTENKDAIEICDGIEFLCYRCKTNIARTLKLLKLFEKDLLRFEFQEHCFECKFRFDYFKNKKDELVKAINILQEASK